MAHVETAAICVDRAADGVGRPRHLRSFTTDDELGVPFDRPVQFGDRRFLTAGIDDGSAIRRQEEADREEFVAPRRMLQPVPSPALPDRPDTGSSAASRRGAPRW